MNKNFKKIVSNKNKLLIIGVVVIVIILLLVILISNKSLKNSITIVFNDENGNAINGLKISIGGAANYQKEFTNNTKITISNAVPGEYTLFIDSIPSNYSCSSFFDDFILEKDKNVKLEYECIKNND